MDPSGCGDLDGDGMGTVEDGCTVETCCMVPCNQYFNDGGSCPAGDENHAGHIGCGAHATLPRTWQSARD